MTPVNLPFISAPALPSFKNLEGLAFSTTTSELMTTGVDAQTCQVIVLDANINSKTKFKQIIGRGTRINEEYGKLFFTILDFRNVTDLFASNTIMRFDKNRISTKFKFGYNSNISVLCGLKTTTNG